MRWVVVLLALAACDPDAGPPRAENTVHLGSVPGLEGCIAYQITVPCQPSALYGCRHDLKIVRCPGATSTAYRSGKQNVAVLTAEGDFEDQKEVLGCTHGVAYDGKKPRCMTKKEWEDGPHDGPGK